MTQHISTSINGAQAGGDVDPRMSLGDFLRDDCGLTGTHLGCEHGVCGACTVIVDDAPVRSCILYAIQTEGRKVRTIEGFDDDEVMARLRKAFSVHHALQCGFCTAGMLITGRDIIIRLGAVDEDRIREELAGNLCRCTGYVGIVRAIQDVAIQMGGPAKTDLMPPATAAISPNLVAPPIDARPVKSSVAAAIAVPAGAVAKSAAGGFSVNRTIEIAYPVKQVWKEFEDPYAIAACLPGAELTETDGDRLHGRVGIKMGPIKAHFVGEASYTRHELNKTGSVIGGGRDSLSNSRASGELQFKMSPGKQESTVLDIQLTFTLQGMLAQFSRPAIVNDFANFIIEQFSENLARRLQSPGNDSKISADGLSLSSLLRWQAARLWRRLLRKSGG
jgi:aerobic carbon-monoxide dehydrogenase small subunit